MYKEQKMKALNLLETPDTTNPDRQHYISEHLKPKCSSFTLGISDSTTIALNEIYWTRHFLTLGSRKMSLTFQTRVVSHNTFHSL